MAIEAPSYFSTNLLPPASSTGATGQMFGFAATYLRFLNTSAVDIYCNLKSSSAASTSDFRVRACSEVVLPSLPCVTGLAIYSTSTGAAPPTLNVTALARSA